MIRHQIFKRPRTDHSQYFVALIKGYCFLDDIPGGRGFRVAQLHHPINDPEQFLIFNRPFGTALKPNPYRRQTAYIVHKIDPDSDDGSQDATDPIPQAF